ncbi:MAG: formyltransferase [Verrucomicrobia bacterium]|jgi:methionyl-tRNA formyltransferase|nr:formyltransferase [Verrucomicrobiota bacterium]MBT7698695.1 formyltransferase [Verrucomicrobiota bacterium]
MRAVVFAYHNMGVIGLEALWRHGIDTTLVLSHHDDPGEQCWFASVAQWCRAQRIACECPVDVNRPQLQSRIAALKPDILFSFFYRRLLSDALLHVAPLGGLNLHASLLPAYRGRCPANWVLVNGEAQTGVTLHHMVARADAGDVVGAAALPIESDDDIMSLYTKLEEAAEALLDELLPLVVAGRAPRVPQDERAVSTYGGRRPADGLLDWSRPAHTQYNLVRAVTDPYPGAFSFLDGERLMVWRAAVDRGHERLVPGRLEVTGSEVRVGCTDAPLKLMDITWKGQRMSRPGLVRLLANYDGAMLTSG